MLPGTQSQPIRYDPIGNLASPPLQAHRTPEPSVGPTGVVYATTRKSP